MSGGKLRAVVVGCHGIGKVHAASIRTSQRVELSGLCDIDEGEARALAEASGAPKVFTDYERMLSDARPDIVTLGVPTSLHASMTIQAAEAGVRGIVCEKPMTSSLAEGQAMLEACQESGSMLIVNHQRRTRSDLIEMRRLAESGAIGEVELVRASTAGDVLTDGTHAIDSLRFLAGDADVEWLLGQVHHAPIVEGQSLGKGVVAVDGQRYRHNCPIESGGMACWQFAGGPRAELYTGDCRLPRPYQHYEVHGAEGSLYRPGDGGEHTLYLRSPATGGRLQPVEVQPDADVHAANYDRLAESIETGAPHPLAGELGFRVLEIIVALYESARLSRRVNFPVQQDNNPMVLMVEAGRFA